MNGGGYTTYTSGCRRRSEAPLRRATTSLVHLLAGLNFDAQSIFRWRNGTRRVWVVSARRIIGFVEIEHDLARLRRVSVQKSRGRIGFISASEIAEYEGELSGCTGLRVETAIPSAHGEGDVPDDWHRVGIAHDSLHLDLPGGIVRNEARDNAVRLVDREPAQALEVASNLAVLVFQANGEPVAARVEIQSQRSHLQPIGG